MELESMFVEQKWNILRELSYEPRSPLQLSEKLDTSMANVSQQLRLLEAANLVRKRKIKNRDRGKPRSLFSLTGDHGYLISASFGFAKKGLTNLDIHKQAVLKIWFLKDEGVHVPLQQAYWELHQRLTEIDSIIIVEEGMDVTLHIAVVKKIKKKLQQMLKFLETYGIGVQVKGLRETRVDLHNTESNSLIILHDKTHTFVKKV